MMVVVVVVDMTLFAVRFVERSSETEFISKIVFLTRTMHGAYNRGIHVLSDIRHDVLNDCRLHVINIMPRQDSHMFDV